MKFYVKSAEKFTRTTPCSNRPVACQLCDEIYWSYNMQTHYSEAHPHSGPVSINIVPTEQEITWLKALAI